MFDSVEIYAVYEDGFDESDCAEIYERLYGLPEVESSLTPDQFRERLSDSEEIRQTATYGSLHFMLVFHSHASVVDGFACLKLPVETLEFDHSELTETVRRERVGNTRTLVQKLYEVSCQIGMPPVYVFGGAPTHVDHLRRGTGFVRTTPEGLQEQRFEELYWLQVLPPEMVNSVGRSRILSATVPSITELSDDAILFTGHERPTEFGEEYLDRLEYFGLERE